MSQLYSFQNNHKYISTPNYDTISMGPDQKNVHKIIKFLKITKL